ncbi:hypothetical protein FOA52_016240 [Chlamydomonas sp. UWO 241]|nr:hypothetical protein FOA52_016240 [Chlamydomonas sp. UWO 241]
MLHWYLFTEVDDPVFGPRASAIYALLVSALQVDPACAVVWEGIRRQQEMLGQLTWVSKELKASKVRAARATQRLHEVISESGPLSELLTLRVPLPLSPDILLMGLVPQECMCFKSAMLPLRLSFAVSPQPVQWQQQPQPQAAGMGASFSGRQHDMFFGSPRTSATFHHGHHHGSSSGSGGGGGGGGAAGGHGFGYAEGGSVGAGLSALEAGGHGSEVSTGSTGIVQQGEQVRCVIIYKKGDDLRQDQFILQMISLMDRLLKRENLDLRLTPYKARFAADRGQMITIVSAYSPTEAASDEEAGDFYLRVAALADKANDKRDLLIVAGGSQRRAWDSSQLRRPAVRREFNLQLSDRFGLLEAVPPEGADAQAEYDAMAAAIREVATNHLAPRGSRRRRGWQFTLSQRTLRLMDARQRAHTAWLRSKSAAAKRERNRANRAADAAVQRDRERWIGQQVAEAQDMLRKKNLRQFARTCDRLAGRSRSHQIPPAMRDVSGALHSGPDGVLKAMTESFDKLYGGETKLSDETLNQLENDVAAFELTRATEVDEAHGRPPDLAETIIDLLEDLHTNTAAAVRLAGKIGHEFPVSSGVLPTSGDDGLVEFVPSTPLSKVLSTHRTIHRYLSQWQADPGGPFGLKAEALETFVRSCAGYCVATYVLGVGDRHLDNLMLTADGRLFHIDFGYILGNDPKPFPPPMKICKEMVEAMGGQGSEYYVQFRMYCCEAYNILRKSADLILSLFHLMAGASIETIRADPEKAILKLQEKFRLDFTDEQAVEYMQMLINESATALMPQIVETTHRWAQYWR